jgi:hypothetical protein
MSTEPLEPLEPLDPELDALLESERHAKSSAGVLEHIWSRIAAASPTGGGGTGSGPRSGWLASHAQSMLAVAFVVGGAAGAAVYGALLKPKPDRVVYIERPVAPAPVALPPIVLAPEGAVRVPIVPPPLPRAAPSGATSLAAERAVIDRARTALASGNASDALLLLDEHVRRFPKPQLTEEREALVIQSLVALGRYEEARATAARFRAASPESLFLPAIEASLESIP